MSHFRSVLGYSYLSGSDDRKFSSSRKNSKQPQLTTTTPSTSSPFSSQPTSMKPNTPESVHSNIMDNRATSFSTSTNRIVLNVAAAESMQALTNGSPSSALRRRTGMDRQRFVALLDEAIRISSEITFADDTLAPTQDRTPSLPPRDSSLE
jgi:hypothetical protein